MFRNLICIISFSLVFNFTNAQTTYFSKTYTVQGNYWESALSVIEVPGQGYIFIGHSKALSGMRQILIYKTDLKGDSLWQKLYGDAWHVYYTGIGGSMIETNDGNYAFGGSVSDSTGFKGTDAILVKFDQNGDTLWLKKYGWAANYSDVFYSCRQTNDGGYILVGFTQESVPSVQPADMYVVKTDSQGNIQWQRKFGGTGSDVGLSVEQTYDGGYIFGGRWNSSFPWIIKTDSAGNQQWAKLISTGTNTGTAVFQMRDSTYFLNSTEGNSNGNNYDVYIAKLDSVGNIQWQKSYGGLEKDWFNMARELNDGSIIAAGAGKNNSYNKIFGWMMKFNAKGDSLWARYYYKRTDISNHLWDIRPTTDNGYILCGSAWDSTQDAWLLKVDSMGCLIPGCDTIVTGTEQVILYPGEMHIYPNPISNHGWIEAIIPPKHKNDECYVQLIDIHGREVRRVPLYPDNLGRTRVRIDRNNLGAGMYFYRLVAGGESLYSGKVVMQ